MTRDHDADARRPVVLVADDDVFVGRAVACVLQAARNAQVHLAKSADQALFLAEQTRPDLVLSDVQMPGMTVLELCRGLRASPSTRGVRIYLLTGVLSSAPSLEHLAQYVQGVLSKPPDPVELLAALDEACGQPDVTGKR